MRRIFTMVCMIACATFVSAQGTITFDFTGNSNAATLVGITDATVTGITVSNANGTNPAITGGYQPLAVTNVAFNTGTSTYATFTVTPDAGKNLSEMTSFSMATTMITTNNNRKPTTYALYSSVDNYATALNSGAISGTVNTPATVGGATALVAPEGAAVTFRIYFYGNTNAGAGGTELMRIDDVVLGGVKLPVELTRFIAKSQENATLLSWETASERDNAFFAVEHSRDGRNFAKIGEVKGAGTSTQRLSYAYTHANATSGINYYRLRQVDLDGKSTLSAVRSVATGRNVLRVFPTLATHQLTVENSDEDNAQPYQIFNLAGQQVLSGEILGRQNVDVSELQNGIYVVRINQSVARFVKQ